MYWWQRLTRPLERTAEPPLSGHTCCALADLSEVRHMETEISAELPKRVEFNPIALAERRWRLLIATVLTPGTLALFLLLVRIAVPFEEVRRINDFNSPIISFFEPARFAIVTISLGLMTVAGVLFLYLQT